MTELRTRITVEGADSLPAVVLLHAFPYHSAMWTEQRAALRGTARVVTLDARGLGPGRKPPAAYMLEHEVDDVLDTLDVLGIQRAILCGLSMGGYVALRAVERAPTRVRGLILADTQAASDGNEAKLARAESLRSLRRDGVAAFARAQVARQLSPTTRSHSPQLVDELRAMICASSVDGIAATLVAIATRSDITSALPAIRVPTCVLVGSEDVVTPPAVSRTLVDAIPGASLNVLENAGHLSNLESPEAFNRLLVEHVSRCP